MAERVGAYYSCAGCIHLQKEKYKEAGLNRLYACSSQRRSGSVVGWVTKDAELNTMGGSCCNILLPGDVIRYQSTLDKNKSRTWLYCGKVKGVKRLMYDRKRKEYKVIPEKFFRIYGYDGNIRTGISVIFHEEARKPWLREEAQKYKRRWLKEHG